MHSLTTKQKNKKTDVNVIKTFIMTYWKEESSVYSLMRLSIELYIINHSTGGFNIKFKHSVTLYFIPYMLKTSYYYEIKIKLL